MYEWILGALGEVFKPPRHSSFRSFLEEGFSLNKEDVLSSFNLDFTPWLRSVADWLDDSETEWVSLLQASQMGKTTLEMAFLVYASQKEPTRFLWVQSTEEEAKQFIKERLKPYIEGYDGDAIFKKGWRIESFKVFNARVKVGYASNEQSLRSLPAQYVIGDECAVWKYPAAYVKKRTRTYTGKRKGIFVTTPPRDPLHHSWQEACLGNFYRWYVKFPCCGNYQPLVMAGLKWEGKEKDGWDLARVKETTYYECQVCRHRLYESDKLDLILNGKPVCVNPHKGYKEMPEVSSNAKALQISALYSNFTTWGETACNFLQAKRAGGEAFKIFITDELAEVPTNSDSIDSLKDEVLAKFIDSSRKSGFVDGYDVYTAGIDVQRNGELYCVICGWKAGVIPTGHVLTSGVVSWQAGAFQQKWANLLHFFAPFQRHLARIVLDSTDGLVSQDIYDFCNYAGRPYMPLKDSTTLHLKTCIKSLIPELNGRKINRPQIVLIANSDKVKDDIASAFQRVPGEVGSWSFPNDVSSDFLKALTMEHRTTDKAGKASWGLKYSHAPNHYFSALVYATAAMEEFRVILQAGLKKASEQLTQRPRVVSQGVSIWR